MIKRIPKEIREEILVKARAGEKIKIGGAVWDQ